MPTFAPEGGSRGSMAEPKAAVKAVPGGLLPLPALRPCGGGGNALEGQWDDRQSRE